MKNETRMCPKCGRTYTEYPAVSRENNEDICPDCGMKEAIEAFIKAQDSKKEATA